MRCWCMRLTSSNPNVHVCVTPFLCVCVFVLTPWFGGCVCVWVEGYVYSLLACVSPCPEQWYEMS